MSKLEDPAVESTAEDAAPALDSRQVGQYIQLGRWKAKLEYLLLAVIVVFVVTIAAVFIAFDLGVDDVRRWGYPGLFVISLLRASSVLLPIPGGGITVAAGAFMDPVLGIPGPIMVGIVVGFAESLGEFTGYAAGMSGTDVLNKRKIYRRIRYWVQRRAWATMFVMSFMPSPLFDVAGLAAGALRVPIRVFYSAILLGKTGRAMMMAFAGFYGFELITRIF
jgi:membrane protein YqaA with SNARE-associated domain